jgi:hypothetical protein
MRHVWGHGSCMPHNMVGSEIYFITPRLRCDTPFNAPLRLIQVDIIMKVSLLHALVLAGGAQAQGGAAMMRFACSQLTVERLDPLVNPGLVGSPHTHQIVGGNSFKADMQPGEHDLVAKSTCTTCTFSEDFR